jgi:hypothetical protein
MEEHEKLEKNRAQTLEQRRTQFWNDGYVILPDVISRDSAATLDSLLQSLRYTPAVKVNAIDTFDEYRSTTEDILEIPALSEMVAKIKITVETLNARWKLQEMRVLKTSKGSEEQCPYRDLDFAYVHKTLRYERYVQARLILSLTGATEVVYAKCTDFADTSKRQELTIEQSSCMLYRADLVHSNPASNRSYRTVQASFSVGNFDWPTTPIPVAVSYRLKKCPYCSLLNSDAQYVTNHTRYCKNNPTSDHLRARRRKQYQMRRECRDCGVVFPSQNTYQKHKPLKCTKSINDIQ